MFSTLISVWAYDLPGPSWTAPARSPRRCAPRSPTNATTSGLRTAPASGMLDWFAGEFESAVETLAAATADLAEIGEEEDVAAVWFVPNDPTVAMHVHLALAQFMAGEVRAAERSLARAGAIAGSIDFPRGPWSAAYASWLGSWMWIEAGRLDRADQAIAELRSSSARHDSTRGS